MKDLQTNFSVVIITFNEEESIQECIQAACRVSQDIIVVDSLSTDRTKQICLKQSSVQFIEQKWLGYSAQKNLGNQRAKYDWILSLDADEILSEKCIAFLQKVDLSSEKQLYKINRLNNYCGQWIKHGRWYPEWKTRLFNKKHYQWNKSLVHEKLESIKNGSEYESIIKKIEGHLYHYSMQSKEEHLQKAEKYAKLSSQKLFNLGKKATLTKRFLSPLSRFLVDFFVKHGFLDGALGFQIAKISAYETYLKYKLLRENKIK